MGELTLQVPSAAAAAALEGLRKATEKVLLGVAQLSGGFEGFRLASGLTSGSGSWLTCWLGSLKGRSWIGALRLLLFPAVAGAAPNWADQSK